MKKTIDIPDQLRYKYRHMNTGELWSDKKLELPSDKAFDTVVAIMRANPPHVNHTAMLKELCKKAIEVKINLGSSNKFDKKNPFKVEERKEMVDLALKDEYDNYKILYLPDFDNDKKWIEYLFDSNEPFSEIISNNDYDLRVYKQHQMNERGFKKYDIISPVDVLDPRDMKYIEGIYEKGKFVKTSKPLYVSGTFVRASMVNDWGWEKLVEPQIAKYIKKNNLIDRIRQFCPELIGKPLEYFDDGR
jgi:nicotinic acid mononucleotide adenylyltransferase